jgi:ADP-ribosylglycohydrolase
MIGAIAGDIIGSVYEIQPIKTKGFPLLHPLSTFTDDSVLTVAVAKAIMVDREDRIVCMSGRSKISLCRVRRNVCRVARVE